MAAKQLKIESREDESFEKVPFQVSNQIQITEDVICANQSLDIEFDNISRHPNLVPTTTVANRIVQSPQSPLDNDPYHVDVGQNITGTDSDVVSTVDSFISNIYVHCCTKLTIIIL